MQLKYSITGNLSNNTCRRLFLQLLKTNTLCQLNQFQSIVRHIQYGKLKRGRGTLKQLVFNVFERQGRVHTEIAPDCKKDFTKRYPR